jgi:hypothetical protein
MTIWSRRRRTGSTVNITPAFSGASWRWTTTAMARSASEPLRDR